MAEFNPQSTQEPKTWDEYVARTQKTIEDINRDTPSLSAKAVAGLSKASDYLFNAEEMRAQQKMDKTLAPSNITNLMPQKLRAGRTAQDLVKEKMGPGNLSRVLPDRLRYAEMGEAMGEAQKVAITELGQDQVNELKSLRDKGVSKQTALDAAHLHTSTPEARAQWDQAINTVFQEDPATGPVQDSQIQDLAQRNKNVAAGKGDVTGHVDVPANLKEDVDEGELIKKSVDLTSTAMNKEINIPKNWYDSTAFNNGLIRFGLGLLSGEDYATAFSQAAQGFDTQYQREKRESYYDELMGQGYSRPEIMEWIQKGDASVLTKKPVSWKQGQDKFGVYQEDTRTGKRQYLVTGKDFALGTGAGGKSKAPAEFQGKAIMGGGRANTANNLWNDDYIDSGDTYALSSTIGTMYAGLDDQSSLKMFGGVVNPEFLRAATKERAYLSGVLRPESGSAISNSEWNNYGSIFFPRHGDTPRDKARKAWMRDVTIKQLNILGGDFTAENEREMAQSIVAQMEQQAGKVVEYRPEQGVVKMTDGKWYSTAN